MNKLTTMFLSVRILLMVGLLFAMVPVQGQVRLASNGTGAFPIYNDKNKALVIYDRQDPVTSQKVAQLFADDVFRVTGYKPAIVDISNKNMSSTAAVIVGTIASHNIRRMISKCKIDTTGLTTGWEQYRIEMVNSPLPGIKKALVVVGSDRRGAAYGLLSISRAIGVSPWYWWLDAPIKKQKNLTVDVVPMTSKSPSVKYRGIFINDEDWGLIPWASKTFEPERKNIGPRTYSKVCELLLRLNANYLCPAMHNCSTAFYQIPENKVVADSFAIVIGTSHCEPLMLNTATEWKKCYGEWNYETNHQTIDSVLEARVRDCAKYENVYTLSLRGLHDVAMKGSNDMAERKDVVQKAIDKQRQILIDIIGKRGKDIPQAFTPYKEVLDIYNKGLRLPDDVTIVWPDDNYGYMKRLSNEKERKRSGRSGVYYHSSYLGRPHDYLWMNTTAATFMYEELRKAYDATADRIWLLNAGDIKSCEFAVDFFLSLAYDIDAFDYNRCADYRAEWTANMIGAEYKQQLNQVFHSFYDLSFQRKPEFMGWGVQWTSDAKGRERVTDTEFSFTNYREADRRLAAYTKIGKKVDDIYNRLPVAMRPCFFESVYYPVKGCELLNKALLYAQKNRWYATQQRAATSDLADMSKACYDSVYAITDHYNSMLGGKWRYVITMKQEGSQSYYEKPKTYTAELAAKPQLAVWPEGEQLTSGQMGQHRLPTFNSLLPTSYVVDVYNQGNGTLNWKAVASKPWIKLSANKGKTAKQQRVDVSVDWTKLPQGNANGEIEFTDNNGGREVVLVSAFNPAKPALAATAPVFVEDNGYVSIDAAHFSRKFENKDVKIQVVPNLGCEGSSVQLGNALDKPQQTNRREAPYVEYDFYTFDRGPVDVYTYVLPTFTLCEETTFSGHESTNSETQYGVTIDGVPIRLESTSSVEYASEWYKNCLSNARINRSKLYIDRPGKHTLRIVCGTPGLIFQKAVIDFGGLQHSYMGPQPTMLK